MHERGQSDSPIVLARSPNNAARAVAEVAEGSGLAKGNAASKTRPGSKAGVSVPSALGRVRRVAQQDRNARFISLLHHVDVPSLSTSGETLTIEESMTLEGENGARRNVGLEHEWSWPGG